MSYKTVCIYHWDKVVQAKDEDTIIQGTVKCCTKGGLIVDVFGLEVFLPGSQVDVKPIRDFDEYVGKQMEFKVVKINQEFKNVVVSHKAPSKSSLKSRLSHHPGPRSGSGARRHGQEHHLLWGVRGLGQTTVWWYHRHELRVGHPEEMVRTKRQQDPELDDDGVLVWEMKLTVPPWMRC